MSYIRSNLKEILTSLLRSWGIKFLIFVCFSNMNAQEVETHVRNNGAASAMANSSIYAEGHVMAVGDILYSIPVDAYNVVGVTIVDGKVIISSGGVSSETGSDNRFLVYDPEPPPRAKSLTPCPC